MVHLEFDLKLVSTNQLYKKSKFGIYLTKVGREFKQALAEQTVAQLPPDFVIFTGPIKADIELYFADGRKHDVDNVKALIDSFESVIYVNDSQIFDLHITKKLKQETNKIIINLSEI
jgi:Holliday junction resolvase RusA-like endonuclease